MRNRTRRDVACLRAGNSSDFPHIDSPHLAKARKMSGFFLRREHPDDHSQISQLLERAFEGPVEARLVDRLRSAGGLTHSFVATAEGQIVGHLAFSPISIGGQLQTPPALALAPVAVLPEYQRQGIGSMLIRQGLDDVRRDGHGVVIVLGHENYYPRFGFVPASNWGIQCPFPVDDSHFMALELLPGALGACRGLVGYRPEFAEL